MLLVDVSSAIMIFSAKKKCVLYFVGTYPTVQVRGVTVFVEKRELANQVQFLDETVSASLAKAMNPPVFPKALSRADGLCNHGKATSQREGKSLNLNGILKIYLVLPPPRSRWVG